MKLYENLTGIRRVSQDVRVSGVAGDTFVLSGWAIGHSVPLGTKQENHRRFGMVLNFVKEGVVSESYEVNFEPSIDTWQYASGVIVAERDFDSIKVQLVITAPTSSTAMT